jgi:hypothetical protein
MKPTQDINENGLRAIYFVTNNMIIKSTYFPHKNIHKKTWQSPDGQTSNQIDHVLVDGRHAASSMVVINCRVVDHDSDHHLICIKY